MKIKQITVRYSKKYPYAKFLNEDVSYDIVFEPSDDIELEDFTSLKEQLQKRTSELKAISDDWHENEMKVANAKEKKIADYKGHIDPEQSGVVIKKSAGEHLATLPQKKEKPLSDDETTLKEINECVDIKALEGYRFVAKTKPEFQKSYDAKLKELKSKK